MSDYTRLTVVGSHRRCEVVVASDEPVGTALPRLLDLLGETGGTVDRPLALVLPDGDRLDVGRSPGEVDLVDGTLLRLTRLDAAPPPPVVIDLTDAAADAHDTHDDRWDASARLATGATVCGVAVAVGAWSGMSAGTAAATVGVEGVMFVVLLALAAGLGLGGLRRVAVFAAAAAAGLCPALGLVAAASRPLTADGSGAALGGAAVTLASLSTVVLIGVGVARGSRGALAGGALGATLATLLLVLLLAGVDPAAAAAISAVAAAFATGPLPWIALSAAGLTTLDEQAAAGSGVPRARAADALGEAYRALSWGVVLVAAVIAVTGVALVVQDELWSGLLAAAVAVTAVLRARAFPLRVQVVALWSAVAALAATALLLQFAGSDGLIGMLVAAVVAVLAATAALVRPRPHVRARLRGLGNVAEGLAVVSLLPLLLGELGIYSELLAVFGGGR